VAEGHDVTIFAPTENDAPMFRASPCRIVLANVAARAVDTASMVQTRIDALKRALVATLRAQAPAGFDVLHAQDSISGNALAELRADGAIPGYVRTVHHLDAFHDPRLAQWQRRAYADADAVFCVSEAWTQTMKTRFGIDAVTVNNGVDVQRFRAAREMDEV